MINYEINSVEDQQADIERIQQLVRDNVELLDDTAYTTVQTNGMMNRPRVGSYSVTITYSKD